MKLIYSYLILVTIMLTTINAESKGEFIIGSFIDPSMSGDPSIDNARLQEFKGLGFNLLTGNGNSKEYFKGKHDFATNQYKLERAADVGIKMIAKDDFYKKSSVHINLKYCPNPGTKIKDAAASVTLFKNLYDTLSPKARGALLGWALADEPSRWHTVYDTSFKADGTIDKIDTLRESNKRFSLLREWCKEIEKQMNEPSYVNFCVSVAGTPENIDTLQLEFFNDNPTPVASMDSYTFYNNYENYSWSKGTSSNPRNGKGPDGLRMRSSFFKGYNTFATYAKENNKDFWAYPLSVTHGNSDLKVMYDERTEATLRFGVSTPLIYGAKGLIYFTYTSPGADSNGEKPSGGWSNPLHGDWYYYGAIMDDNTTYGIKSWVRSVNSEIRNMESTLMSLSWITTIHGNSENNYHCNDGWSDKLVDPESGLPVATSATPVIDEVIGNSKDCAVGIFKNDSYYFLIVMNKDVENSHSFSFKLKGGYKSSIHNKSDKNWSRLTGKRRVITVKDIAPGDFELIKLDRSIAENVVLY